MGNVQTASIANQILPTESYVQDINELRYDRSLGATRFLKTAAVRSDDGLAVIKVFVLSEEVPHLDEYLSRISHIRRKLRDSPNCLPFTKTFRTERCVIVHRPLRKFTLYERLSTRPFLLEVEKLWIAFQLLKGLTQCRMHGIRHGDIKAQNILLSSSGWVQIADFAPFKPAFIPYDNPSTFTFFFDTSRRRTCYIAPERFKSAEELAYSARRPEDLPKEEALTEAMDIFSMGCVLVELLTDGRHVAFNLSQGIDYSRMDEHVADAYLQKLLGVCPDDFRTLLSIMLDRDPEKRKENFERYLPQLNSLFPPLFESFLYKYFKELRGLQDADELILKLFVEFPNHQQLLEANGTQSVVLFINMVTANIRSCHSMAMKMDAIGLLKKLATLAEPSVIADRIVPYLVGMLVDYYAQVRGEAVIVIADTLEMMNAIPYDESRLLVDYVLPRFKPLTDDPSDYVKTMLAASLGRLAMISLRFFNEASAKLNDEATAMTDFQGTDQPDRDTVQRIIESERSALQDAISEIFVNLCGASSFVRQTLFAVDNLQLLCEFFGSNKAVDVLMHMITLLNDKEDWGLRATFFSSCPTVADHSATIRNSKLVPFLQQGLQDAEESVTSHTLTCLYRLCDRNLLEKSVISELMRDVVPFLAHPNKWYRAQVVNILAVLDSIFSVADVYCKLIPLVRPYLTEALIRLGDRNVVYSCLVEPIPRQIWDLVAGYDNVPALLREFEDQRTLDKLGGGRNSFFSVGAAVSPESPPRRPTRLDPTGAPLADGGLEVLLKKLKNAGLNENVEDQLLAFRGIFRKMDKSKRSAKRDADSPTGNYRVQLGMLPTVRRMVFDLETGTHRAVRLLGSMPAHLADIAKDLADPSAESALRPLEVPFETAVHSKMQLAEAFAHKQERYREQRRVTNSSSLLAPRGPKDASAIPVQLGGLMVSSSETVSAMAPTRTNSPSSIRRPELRLNAHLHEHAEKILQLAAHPHDEVFASCSADNTVKIWPVSQARLKNQPATLSKETYHYAYTTNSLAFMQNNGNHLAMGRENAELMIQDVVHHRPLRNFSMDLHADGSVTQICASDHLIYALTHHSAVYCLDLRAPSGTRSGQLQLDPVFYQRARNSCGWVTGLSVDAINQHWMLLTASSSTTKNMILWDLRFGGLEVACWAHPAQEHVTPFRSWPYAMHPSHCNEVITNSAKSGELTVWDLRTRARTDILWPGSDRPLNYEKDLVTSAVVTCPQLHGVFTGDSEGSLRFWNMNGHANRSNYLSGPYRKFAGHWTAAEGFGAVGRPEDNVLQRVQYAFQAVPNDAPRLQVESRVSDRPLSEAEFPTIPQVSDAHRNGISDMIALGADCLISGSVDGVVKVWRVHAA